MHRIHLLAGLFAASATLPVQAVEPFQPWSAADYAIATPLGGHVGDAARGRQVAIDRARGNCLACHAMPIPEEGFHGNIAPPLHGVGSRLSAAQIRLRIADESSINPATIMPSFYKDPARLNRVGDEYYGRNMLTAQEVEDLVAYLVTLK